MHFAQNEHSLLEAYVESGEGKDRAGGFAIQVRAYRPQSTRCAQTWARLTRARPRRASAGCS